MVPAANKTKRLSSVNHTTKTIQFNWFHFLFLEGALLVIVKDCMIFLSPFLDVTGMSMSTVSFLAQLESGILCLENTFI